MPSELVNAMISMKEPEALRVAEKMLKEGTDPLKVLEECRQALETVGKEFEAGKFYLPELILSGRMLKKIAALAEPYLKKDSAAGGAKKLGKVVIGSVKGDIHDIGKDMVTFLLDVNGFEVIDLGVDVPPEKFVEAIKEAQPDIVGMSALLTTVLEAIKTTVEAIQTAGLRDRVKIMIGGTATDDKVKAYAGADAYGKDAVAAISLAKEWVAA